MAFPRVVAIEVAVEFDGGMRGILRIERPTVHTFDRGSDDDVVRRIRFEATGHVIPIGDHFKPTPRRRRS